MNEWACSVDWPATIGVVKDIALTLAAIATASIAVIGINAWRHQGKAKARFEVAKDYVTAILALRDALADARVPMISYLEYPPPEDGEHQIDPNSGRVKAFVYSNRWEPVKDALAGFRESSPVAEALFGETLAGHSTDMRKHAHKVSVAMNTIIEQAYTGNHDFEDADYRQTVYADAHASIGNVDNALSNAIRDTVADVQTLLSGSLTWTDS